MSARVTAEATVTASRRPSGERRLIEHGVAQADGSLGAGRQIADDRVEGDPVAAAVK